MSKSIEEEKALLDMVGHGESWTLESRRAFAKLPIEQKRLMLEEMAAQAEPYYNDEVARKEREEWQGGDIVEY